MLHLKIEFINNISLESAFMKFLTVSGGGGGGGKGLTIAGCKNIGGEVVPGTRRHRTQETPYVTSIYNLQIPRLSIYHREKIKQYYILSLFKKRLYTGNKIL